MGVAGRFATPLIDYRRETVAGHNNMDVLNITMESINTMIMREASRNSCNITLNN